MAEVLTSLSDALASIVESSAPSVVRVEGRGRFPASGIVWSDDGVILVANHSLESDEGVSIGLPSGDGVQATVAGRDQSRDIAVLRVQAAGLKPAAWHGIDSLRVGHVVLALGRPGQSVRATLGIVSALGGSWVSPVGGRIERYLQTDLVMYPGFSGGPLVDAAGKFIGMNTSALLRGVSVTVPSLAIRPVVQALLEHGRVRQGYLGVGTQPVRLTPVLAQQVGQETGLLLVSVAPGGPAEQAGLLLGDIIISVGGHPARQIDDLLTFLSDAKVGGKVQLRIVRGGKSLDLPITIGERP